MGRRKEAEPPPEWTGEDLVVCEDGPRAGAWYFLTHGPGSWTELRRHARLNGETEADGRTLGYVPTDQWTPHRTWPAIRARVMLWSPDLARQARHRQEGIDGRPPSVRGSTP